jgi:hypothetical protein
MIDITTLAHDTISRSECKLYHSRDACDRVDHFVQNHQDMLDAAEVILIERQPLGGLMHVEQLLYSRYRDKAILCSPNSLHKWMGINILDYDHRKEETVLRAHSYLCQLPHYEKEERKHDMADAACLLMHYCSVQHSVCKKKLEAARRKAEYDRVASVLHNCDSVGDWFDSFKFKFRGMFDGKSSEACSTLL